MLLGTFTASLLGVVAHRRRVRRGAKKVQFIFIFRYYFKCLAK